ncbi:hypothetical protein [Myxococcus sp. RHSTA-1-4]|uniref:hypothetical protein n=1 Tax=Myxococcus sp. RHSTA-1-4 TaxID=2874601 RepID=UPI001CBE23D5|nr:hypothetical protein [Myxococcus sp. RHSTA-1-4]MBZ4417715.1 hypothetical protein [Myxococcus sp. RHSTA-1-4]
MRAFLSAGVLVLNCPGCGSKVAANTSICSVCDYIIDGSFLSDEPPADNAEEYDDAPEEPRRAAKPAAAARPKGKSGARTAVPDSDATNIRSMDEIARSAPPRPARAAGGSRSAPAARPAPPPRRAPEPVVPPVDDGPDPWDRSARASSSEDGVADPEELIRDAKELFGLLAGGDKVAFWGAAVVVLSCFLPWKETATEGDILGLMSMGAGAFALSIFVMTAIGMRVKGSLERLNPVVPWMGQLISSFVCLVWCLIFIKMASDSTRVPSEFGNAEVMNSTPSMGVFIAVLGSLASLGGTLLGLKSKPH